MYYVYILLKDFLLSSSFRKLLPKDLYVCTLRYSNDKEFMQESFFRVFSSHFFIVGACGVYTCIYCICEASIVIEYDE